MTEEKKPVKFDAIDFVGLLGTILLSSGCYMAWAPLGLIVPGAIFVIAAAGAAKQTAKQAKQ